MKEYANLILLAMFFTRQNPRNLYDLGDEALEREFIGAQKIVVKLREWLKSERSGNWEKVWEARTP